MFTCAACGFKFPFSQHGFDGLCVDCFNDRLHAFDYTDCEYEIEVL